MIPLRGMGQHLGQRGYHDPTKGYGAAFGPAWQSMIPLRGMEQHFGQRGSP